jgi:hypothetical protein
MHGERAERAGHAGKEFWSRRGGPKVRTHPVTPYGKKLTHRQERREKRKIERSAIKDDHIQDGI